MRAHEFIIERKKKKKKFRYGAYGPGPYGGYGFLTGYSGDSSGDGGAGESIGNYLQDKLPTAKPAKKMWDFIDANPKLRWLLKLNPTTASFVRPKPHEAQGIVDILNLLGQKRLASMYSQMPTGKTVPPNEIPAMDQAFMKVLDFAKQNPDHPAVKKLSQSAVGENFADGKVKGKSRPGRVKRAGASCKGSVTDLRKRAKNASGEKAKMYHWCANMKSGRNK